MPLVMWPIGTCSSDRPGKSGVHIARETWPCSDDTALARRDSFSARIVMQKPSCGSHGIDASERHQLVRGSSSMRLAQRAEMLVDERAGRSDRGPRAPACAS